MHIDLWGPSLIQSVAGHRYYFSFVDDNSWFTWIFPLKGKREALNAFVQFKNLVENQFVKKIKNLQSDWGGEYRSFLNITQASRINFRHSCPHISAQNGRSQRKHRHIVETGLALLHHASLPACFWAHAFSSAVYLINRLPSTILKFKSPFQLLFNRAPNYCFLKVFGAACWPHLRPFN